MEIKPGYKQTEIGVIPEDWEVYTIQELIDQGCILYHMDGNHGSYYPRNKEFKPHGVPYIGTNDFDQGTVSFLKCKYLSYQRASSMKKGIAQDGDILFAHNATVGPVARLTTEYSFVILSTSATAYRTDNLRLFNEWLLFIMQSDFFVRQYTANMSQTTRNQVPITMQRKLLVPVSRPDEQKLISAVLSDIDSLITSLEKLIEKKKLIKQGVMQELLTGKRRLPGFSGEWETKRLGDIASIKKGQQLNSDCFGDFGVYPVMNGGILPSGYTTDYNSDGKELIISEGGNSCGFVNYVEGRFWQGGHCYSLTTDQDDMYLYYALKFKEKEIMGLRVGSGLPNVQKNRLSELPTLLPTIQEQSEIAAVLTDIGSEIKNLEMSRAKHLLLKQAMMQELLTGRIRLI